MDTLPVPGGSGLISSHRAKGWHGLRGEMLWPWFWVEGCPGQCGASQEQGAFLPWVKGRALGLGKPERRTHPLQKP